MKKRIVFFGACLCLLSPISAKAGSIVVSNLNDTGPGSLRQAIMDANANAGPDTITFSISGTINDDQKTNGDMPHVADNNTTIDATGQSITLKAAGVNHSPPPIVIDSSNNTIKGFTINGYTGGDGMEVGGNNNLISNMVLNGNSQGIRINGNNNRVEGCFIGTNATGTSAVANTLSGLIVQAGATGNTIGGTTAAQRNIISGNGGDGMQIDGAPGNTVEGNYIGTNATGSAAIPNGGEGLLISDLGTASTDNVIGGTTPGAGNLISGNAGHGIKINWNTTTGNLIQGNLIGTNAAGNAGIANGGGGVVIDFGASGNTIGGADPGTGNTIAFNTGVGIGMATTGGTGNAFLENSIFSNTGLGIDLKLDGITANDAGDGDSGPNKLQNFPVLSLVSTASGATRVQGSLNSSPNANFRLEFFSNAACDASGNGEGQTFLGFTNVTTNGSGDAGFDVVLANPSDTRVTATATDSLNNTSEFSSCSTTTHPGSLQFSTAASSVNESDGTATVTITRVDGSDGNVSATFSTSAGTATAGTDYTETTQTVSFAAGDTADKTVLIPIVSDAVVEGTETVNLGLSNPTGGVLLGSPSTAVLNIMDNCGDGTVDPGEQCDDGNNTNADGCEADCTLPVCGNGIVDAGEACDDGNKTDGDACETNCTLPACGNQIVDKGEQCDGSSDTACHGQCIAAGQTNACQCPSSSGGGSGGGTGNGNGTTTTQKAAGCSLIR